MQVETEVSRLQELKASKMNELVLKKKTELEELRCRTHLVARTDNAFKFAGEATKDGNSLKLVTVYGIKWFVIIINDL